MSDSPVPLSSSAFPSVVDRLRAAGCVFAEDEARLLLEAAASTAELDAMVARRVGGLPLEHVLGWARFCGLRIAVDPGVFVPRPRTEFLVQQAAELAPPGAVLVDLCCGSGALGVALAHRLGAPERPVELHAADIDPAAVACARRNVAPLGGHAYEGDLFAALPPAASLRGRIDTAKYKLVLKGSDRGKWECTVVAEADAPLVTVETVVRGVQRRSGDSEEPDRMSGDDARDYLLAAAR